MRTSLCFSLMSYGGSYDFFRPFDKEIVSSECKKLNGRIYVNLKPRTYDCRASKVFCLFELTLLPVVFGKAGFLFVGRIESSFPASRIFWNECFFDKLV